MKLVFNPFTGKLDFVDTGGGSSITLETNSVLNGSQTLLNLVQGTNMTITDDGFGNITFNGAASLTFANSLQNIAGTVNLVNDSTSPGNSYYYGTDSGGTKGFFTLPSGGFPAGMDTQVQYNNMGVFGANANFIYDQQPGGSFTAIAQDGPDAADGGNVTIKTGHGGATSGGGGTLTLAAQSAQGSGTGGGINILTGDGANGNNAGGINFAAGAGNGAGIGGGLDFQGGIGGDTGDGGYIHFLAGSGGATSGTGGGVSITSGNGGSTSGSAGAINIIGGHAILGDGDGGIITLEAGSKSGAGSEGIIRLKDGGATNYADLHTSLLSADREYYFPNASGTLALLGLLKLDATGTVDGVNADFTFTTAPSIVFVDGVVKQRVSSDGTVNWTIVGLTVTLTVAPNFDIFGI